jgi:hypothetical protein
MATNEQETNFKSSGDEEDNMQERAISPQGEEVLMIDNGEYNNEKRQGEGDMRTHPPSISEATIDDQVAKLDFLGPIIINTDGTLARIPNWNTLTVPEQTNTLRLIAKRNKARIEVLKQERPELLLSYTQTL